MKESYSNKSYSYSVSNGFDDLYVNKNPSSDWMEIKMVTNDLANGVITIRSKEMAEQLHFMLGQLIKE